MPFVARKGKKWRSKGVWEKTNPLRGGGCHGILSVQEKDVHVEEVKVIADEVLVVELVEFKDDTDPLEAILNLLLFTKVAVKVTHVVGDSETQETIHLFACIR